VKKYSLNNVQNRLLMVFVKMMVINDDDDDDDSCRAPSSSMYFVQFQSAQQTSLLRVLEDRNVAAGENDRSLRTGLQGRFRLV